MGPRLKNEIGHHSDYANRGPEQLHRDPPNRSPPPQKDDNAAQRNKARRNPGTMVAKSGPDSSKRRHRPSESKENVHKGHQS